MKAESELIKACTNNDVAKAEVAIRSASLIDIVKTARNEYKESAIFIAAKKGYVPLFKMLLAQGADLTARTDGNSYLLNGSYVSNINAFDIAEDEHILKALITHAVLYLDSNQQELLLHRKNEKQVLLFVYNTYKKEYRDELIGDLIQKSSVENTKRLIDEFEKLVGEGSASVVCYRALLDKHIEIIKDKKIAAKIQVKISVEATNILNRIKFYDHLKSFQYLPKNEASKTLISTLEKAATQFKQDGDKGAFTSTALSAIEHALDAGLAKVSNWRIAIGVLLYALSFIFRIPKQCIQFFNTPTAAQNKLEKLRAQLLSEKELIVLCDHQPSAPRAEAYIVSTEIPVAEIVHNEDINAFLAK